MRFLENAQCFVGAFLQIKKLKSQSRIEYLGSYTIPGNF